MKEVSCPVCNADVLLDGDESTGETVFCSYCKSPLKVLVKPSDRSTTLVDDT
jgi:DNA-directed RNA polymerase subunit RPC12/RpoP